MSSPQSRPPARRRAGFSLPEILIVIGIIVVLAALLLQVRSRATDKAAQVLCMSNVRQIGLALMAYAQDNEQVFPFSSPLVGSNTAPHPKEDWIHWRAYNGKSIEETINNSAIAPYAKARGAAFQALMRCPTDDWENHSNPYPYSYSFNYMFTPDASMNAAPSATPGKPPTPRLSSINRPGEKILVAEENERTINDGLWAPGNYTDAARSNWVVQWDWLSVRHDTRSKEFNTPVVGTLPQQKLRGNVVFADGHAEYVGRRYAHDPQHLLPNFEGTGVVPAPPPGG